MTLRADLTALLADAGIVDVDIDQAVEDEHVRSSAYRKVLAAVAAAERRDNDRAVVSVILRDPEGLVSKSAVVELVDRIAMKMPVLAVLTEIGSTKKIRNIARNRAGSRAVRDG